MKIRINKQNIKLILESNMNNSIIEKSKKYFNALYNYFINPHYKYLNEKQFGCLLNVIYEWYYRNFKFSNDFFDVEKCEADALNTIKLNTKKKFPSKLYRGLSFNTKKELDVFIKRGIIDTTKFSENKYFKYTSWTSNKKVANKFLPGGDFTPEIKKFGILITVKLNTYKNDFVFSMEQFLENEDEKRLFLKNIFSKEYSKNMRILNSSKNLAGLQDQGMIGVMHGSLFSVKEYEYILDSIKLKDCEYEIQNKQTRN